MAKERFKSIAAVYLILERGDEVFLMRRANTGYMDGTYSVPAGHHDGGQTFREGLAREAGEELGITIRPEDARLVYLHHRPYAVDGDRIDAYFVVNAWEGEPKNLEPHKCDDIGWFKKSALPETMNPKEREVFAAIARGENYGEITQREG